MAEARETPSVLIAVVGAAVSLAACGGGAGGAGGGPIAIDWTGTMISSTTFGHRGAFRLVGTLTGGSIAGTLTLDPGAPSESTQSSVGSVVEEYDAYSRLVRVVDFGTANGSVSFSASVYASISNDTFMMGSYVDGSDAGRWHSVLAGGVQEAAVDRSFQIYWTVHDLCFDGASLFAVASPAAGGAAGVYVVDRDTGGFTEVVLAPVPAEPRGVAFDGTTYWISDVPQTPPDPATVRAYAPGTPWTQGTSSWEVAAIYPPEAIAFSGGSIWFAPFFSTFGGGVQTIDVSDGTLASTGIVADRSMGIELVDGVPWTSRQGAGGEWGTLVEHPLAGEEVARFYMPDENAGPIAREGDYLWAVSGGGLHRIRFR